MAEASTTKRHVEMRPLGLDRYQIIGLLLIALGVALSFGRALAGHGPHSHHIDVALLSLQLLPWLIYGLLFTTLRGLVLVAAGAVLLGIHAFLVL